MTATLEETRSVAEELPDRKAAERRCLASGAVRQKDELLRFVVDPDGYVLFDAARKLPGRGLWLSPERDMIERACGRNLFARAAKQPVKLRDGLVDQVASVLRRRCLDTIGLARRAGLVTNGFEKVKAQLAGGGRMPGRRALVQAVDAALGGRQKLAALAGAVQPSPVLVELFTVDELGGVLGREEAVHLLLAPGSITERFLADAAHLGAVIGTGEGREQDMSV